MKYRSTGDFMHSLFGKPISRKTLVRGLFGDSDIAAIATEHGVHRDALLEAITAEESPAGARLRAAVTRMRAAAAHVPHGNAFPENLDDVSDGALEFIGLYVNPLATTAMILNTAPPPLDDAARAIDPALSLAAFA
ncbi:MAG TPA: hypothetical protein VFN49_11905, partial [Candidatus Aquilonibacter sp.]|nr:hypothetical protein [Candidatus Aquilonibacter sp.]